MAQGGPVQLVRALEVDGELGRQRSVFSGGGGIGSMMNSSILATNYPDEHGRGIVVIRGGFGWKESMGGGALCEEIKRSSVRLGWLDSGEMMLY